MSKRVCRPEKASQRQAIPWFEFLRVMVVFPKGADLSRLGIGLQAGEDGSIRLTAYHSDAPLTPTGNFWKAFMADGRGPT